MLTNGQIQDEIAAQHEPRARAEVGSLYYTSLSFHKEALLLFYLWYELSSLTDRLAGNSI